ncbi:TonB-dependent receptor, partial [Candidatus Fermentibacteria bacterium]|nr:TonB-dependent receptor [Candidatus Fermentibacteria bacterium]
DRHSSGLADFSVARMFRIGPAAFTAGADLAWDRVASTASGIHGRLRAGLTAGASLASSGVPLTATVRVEHQPGGRTMEGARLGATFAILGDSALSVSFTAARGFRRPTFNDLYWPADAFAEGNPGLVPETCREIEAVLSSRPCRLLSLELAGWLARDSDLISWQPCADGRWRPGNTASVHRMGLEASTVLRTWLLEIAGSVSLMETEDATPGSVNAGCRLPYRPGITTGMTAGIDAGVLYITAAAGWTGRRYTNAANTAWLDPRLLVDLAADWDPGRAGGWGAGIRASNLLDAEYEESNGYPGRPRTVGIEIHWKEEP